jgi:hypothetical protein
VAPYDDIQVGRTRRGKRIDTTRIRHSKSIAFLSRGEPILRLNDECTKGLLNENKTRRVYILNEMSTSGMAQANGFRVMEFVRGFERLQRSVVSWDCPGGRKAGSTMIR